MRLFAKGHVADCDHLIIGRLTRDAYLPPPQRQAAILLVERDDDVAGMDLHGYAAIACHGGSPPSGELPSIGIPTPLFYADAGDILRINPVTKEIRVAYRQASRFNTLFITEQCNSSCLMCSQPPRDVDDSHLLDEILQAIPLMDPATTALGITGGEPMLAGPKLVEIIKSCRDHLPKTALQMLTNGRLAAYRSNVEKIADLQHPDFTWAVPLYSDIPREHDFVVQADGAFDETIRGLLNLNRYGQYVELRVVIHGQTYQRLPELAQFVVRNLPFVGHVALMGMEMTGHVHMNLDALWIDPLDYQSQLADTVHILAAGRVTPVIFNHQLCLLKPELRPYAVKSISDWKNVYMKECEGCQAQDDCGGFFASASTRYSRGITPIRASF